ncbi:MAG TPA: polyhydroxyalkanoate depolymerase [Polyangiaceae bacterium]|nr:polyhydroxyalkanoate depolymerase [Polyangiaceae bacterium]
MLYQLHELQHISLLPTRAWATANMAVFGCPFSPLSYTPMSRMIVAGSDLLLRATNRYQKPQFELPSTVVDGECVAVVEETVLEKAFCSLLHFARDKNVKQPRVLIVAPLSGHYATLLRDTVKSFIHDHDVYITDWHDARMVPLSKGPFSFDDYVSYVTEFVRLLGPDVHVVSVCQPTVPVLVAISLMAADDRVGPLTMTLMGGPIDTRKNPTSVNTFAADRPLSWFENKIIQTVPANYPGYLRRVCPGFLQLAGFVSMNAGRHFNAHKDYFYHLVQGDGESAEAHRKFYDEYNAVMDLPAEYYLDSVKMVFQEHQLARGTMIALGRLVTPSAITKTALFTIEGELDDISGSGQTQAAHGLCSGIAPGDHHHLTAEGAGHYGIFSGRRFREIIYPKIRAFIGDYARSRRPRVKRG